jgi:hypothetical protein
MSSNFGGGWGLTGALDLSANLLEDVRGLCGGRGDVMDVEDFERGHLDEGPEEVFGESVHVLDPRSATHPALFVLVLEPTEVEVQVTYDVLAGPQESLAGVGDGLGERSDITSGLVTLREREREGKAQNCLR